MTSRAQAREAIYSTFWEGWNEPATVLLGYSPKAFWQKKEAYESKGPDNEAWIRVTLRHVEGYQSTFGVSRYHTREGIFICQLFTPCFNKDGEEIDDSLAELVLQVLEGDWRAHGIMFRNANAREIGESENWFQTNITAEFEYRQLR